MRCGGRSGPTSGRCSKRRWEAIEGTYVEEQLLIMERNGYPEETYYTFSYSPIPDDDGSVGGIICANTDDTQRVIGERQITLLRELSASTADARSWQDAVSKARVRLPRTGATCRSRCCTADRTAASCHLRDRRISTRAIRRRPLRSIGQIPRRGLSRRLSPPIRRRLFPIWTNCSRTIFRPAHGIVRRFRLQSCRSCLCNCRC